MKYRQCASCGTRYSTSKSACPECGVYGEKSEAPVNTLGYPQCEWESSGERCRYPGSMSSNIGGGSWYCRLHYDCKSSSEGAQFVAASRDYRHPTRDELVREATEEARKATGGQRLKHVPRSIGAVDKLAWAKQIIAKGQGNVSTLQWQMATAALNYREAA